MLLVDNSGRVYRTTSDNERAVAQELPGTTMQVVQHLVGSYEELGVVVNSAVSAEGRVSSSNFVAPRRIGGEPVGSYVNCGTDYHGRARADLFAVTLNTTSLVTPASAGRVRVSTIVTATAQQRGVSGNSIACESTGALERRIHALAATRAAQ